jgi:Zn-dependent protease with chaperone function
MGLLAGAAASLLVLAASPLVKRHTQDWPVQSRAHFLFVLRLLPAAAGLIFTVGVALPSFLLLEPVHTKERVGLRLLALAGLGLGVALSAAYRAVLAWTRLARLRRHWMRSATRLTTAGTGVQVFEVVDPSAQIVVTGIWKPTVFFSRQVVSGLSAPESAAAIAHEVAHVSARDNLKQLLLQATRLPFFDRLSGLDREWRLATEMAADEAALRAGTPVLELASALVKVARMRFAPTLAAEAAVSYFLPPGKDSMLSARVEHLKQLLERDEPIKPALKSTSLSWVGLAVALGLFSVIVSHSNLLLLTHELLEKLV